MKRAMMAAMLTGALAFSGMASAQSTVKLNMEDTHLIKETVLKDPKIPHAKAGTFEIGDAAPSDVTLQQFPTDVTSRISAVKGHSYFIAGQQIVLVSTSDKKIAEIIK